jgi:hypothetical protein
MVKVGINRFGRIGRNGFAWSPGRSQTRAKPCGGAVMIDGSDDVAVLGEKAS